MPEFNQEEILGMMRGFLRQQELVVREIMQGMDENIRISKGLMNFVEKLEDDKHETDANKLTLDNVKYMLRIMAKSQATASMNSAKVMAIMLAYAMGDNFKSDSAGVMLKLGAGKEALQELFRAKFGDDFARKFQEGVGKARK